MCWVPLVAAAPLPGAGGVHQVATGQAGQTAFEFIGTISQNGGNFKMSSYITAIAGLPETALFTDPSIRSQATARFSFEVTAALVSRNVLNPIFAIDSTGQASISITEFVAGVPSEVTTGSVTVQTTIQATAAFTPQSPGKGNFRASGQFIQSSPGSFTLGGVTYHFGSPNRVLLLTASGDGTLTNAQTPVSQIIVAGNAIVCEDTPSQLDR